ncbi:MAG: Processing alpha glucosidase I [Tremellales sp. Tagirdzhanova-0007]|nr:MAG: Processing alpha glucosidase I [Tremellales sp. Tagirdzhanova-0007]
MTNRSLFWNTYRPQLYHGIRPRLPHSLMTGLMWFGLNDYNGNNEIRHTAEQSDGLTSYSYTQHDGRSFSIQDLVDGKNNVKLTVSWLKSEDGRDWSVRIEGDAIDPARPARTSFIYHLGLEGLGELALLNEPDDDGIEGSITLRGSSPQLGNFRIRIVDHPSAIPLQVMINPEEFSHLVGKTAFFGWGIPTGEVWRIKDYIIRSINTGAQALMQGGRYTPESPPDPLALFRLQNEVYSSANVFAFQKAFGKNAREDAGKWGFDVFYESLDGTEEAEGLSHNSFSQSIHAASAKYVTRFRTSFPMPAPFNSPEHTIFAQAMTSNLLGGIGYYHGASIVDRAFRHDYDDDEEEGEVGVEKPLLTEERELLTATPSRSFFPRGFYWDEGFHLALIGEWDNDLSLEILKDWIALIDEDGWVAREQILGEESRSKVPREFWTQYPSYANPPTLTMAVTSFIRRLRAQSSSSMLDSLLQFDAPPTSFSPETPSSKLPNLHLANPSLAHSYLTSIYPALRRHYLWFRRTQRGLLKPYGRYPTSRTEAARPPHSGELHLDLMSWMGFFARTMGEISEFLRLQDDREEYARHETGILANLDDLHWSDDEQMYCDVSVNDEDESIHVCHRGYISLFPFLLGILPPSSPHLPPMLDMITSSSHLWSPYGIRSLSKSHPLFGKDENYWRGPIWVQMNWLVLKSLKERYTVEEGPERERATKVYAELRKNVVDNVFREWKRTGYVWEQYDSETGEGRRRYGSFPVGVGEALIQLVILLPDGQRLLR